MRAAAELGERAGVSTGEVVSSAGSLIGAPLVTAERLARSAAPGEIRLARPTGQAVPPAARGTEQPDGGFVLHEIDPDAPAISRRLNDQPLVGRDAELEVLRTSFRRVARSAGRSC